MAISGLREFSSKGAWGPARVLGFRETLRTKMIPTVNVPFFDGKSKSFSNCAQEVGLWSRVTNLEPVAREVRMAGGTDQITDQNGAMKIMQLLNDYFAPGAADSANEEVARNSNDG